MEPAVAPLTPERTERENNYDEMIRELSAAAEGGGSTYHIDTLTCQLLAQLERGSEREVAKEQQSSLYGGQLI